MRRWRIPEATSVALLLALALGCGRGGGASGSGGAPGAAGGVGIPPGSDPDAPLVEILDPARGAFLPPGTIVVRGTAQDAGSGVWMLLLNGVPTPVDPAGSFQAAVTLAWGVNTITARAIDRAGNVASASISVISGEYRPATDEVHGASGLRLNEQALNRVAPFIARSFLGSATFQQALLGGPIYRGALTDPFFGTCIASAEVRVLAFRFDTPQLQIDCVQGGVNAILRLPNARLTANAHDYCGIGYSATGDVTAVEAVADAGFDISLDAAGNFLVAPRYATVLLNGFRLAIQGIPSVISNLVYSEVKSAIEDALADAIRRYLPGALSSTFASLSQPMTIPLPGGSVSVLARATTLDFDDFGFSAAYAGNAIAPRNPQVPAAPGSLHLSGPAGTVPAMGTAFGFYGTVGENFLNRILFTSWQAGCWHVTVDQQFLASFNVTLPFQLDGQWIAHFFPALQGMIVPGQMVPVGFQFEPALQPVMRVVGGTELFRLQVGELHMTLLMDFGGGFTPIMTVALHLDAGCGVSFARNAFTFTLTSQPVFEAQLLWSAIPLNGIDVGRFLTFFVPSAIQAAIQSVQPTPLPTLQGAILTNLAAYQDGIQGDFATVSGDVW